MKKVIDFIPVRSYMAARGRAASSLLIATCFLVQGQVPRTRADSGIADDRLSRAVRAAKQRGDTSVNVPSPIVNDSGITSVDDLLANYTVLVAEAGEPITVQERYGFLSTWTKLKVIETLSRQPKIDAEPLDDHEVPVSLLPLKADELLLKMDGGSISVDGIRVTQALPVQLQPGSRYLLCVFLSNHGRAAVLASGSAGVYHVSDAGQIAPLGKSFDPLITDVQIRYRNRLDLMREDIQNRSQ